MKEPDPSPGQLLAAARIVAERPGAIAGTGWARSSAVLTRQALERAVELYWAACARGMEDTTRTTQLLCLPWFHPDRRAVKRAHYTWSELSSACHYYAYDIGPTTVELRRWMEEVNELIRAFDGSHGSAGVTIA
jgi:hypothetical protein